MFLGSLFSSSTVTAQPTGSFYDLQALGIDGQPVELAQFKGKVALVVNTASNCGFTSQYAGLERLYDKYKDQGLVVLGFPSNDFGGQEPGSNEEIQQFCSTKFKVSFPLFDKSPVSGADKQQAYKFLVDSVGGKEILWNFEKFLVGRDGKVIDRWRSITTPESGSLVSAIEKALAEKS